VGSFTSRYGDPNKKSHTRGSNLSVGYRAFLLMIGRRRHASKKPETSLIHIIMPNYV
jgi:hypothetical protein